MCGFQGPSVDGCSTASWDLGALTGGDEQAGMVLAKQLTYENANSPCQAALRLYKRKGGLSDYVRICADIGPSYVQDITLAATLQEKTVKKVLYQQQKRDKTSGRSQVPGSGCFSCGQMGHQATHCLQKQAQRPAQAPNICPRCKKDKHWAKDCRSKTDLQGKPLPPVSENWVRGQPQAPKQCYRAIQNLTTLETLQGQKTKLLPSCSEQLQGVQDWTSVPPPTQY